MPLHIPTFPDDEYDTVIVGPNTNEALVLKALRAESECTHATLNAKLVLESDAISGALSRLRKKDLLTYEQGTYALANSTVATLADSLIPLDNMEAVDASDMVNTE